MYCTGNQPYLQTLQTIYGSRPLVLPNMRNMMIPKTIKYNKKQETKELSIRKQSDKTITKKIHSRKNKHLPIDCNTTVRLSSTYAEDNVVNRKRMNQKQISSKSKQQSQ